MTLPLGLGRSYNGGMSPAPIVWIVADALHTQVWAAALRQVGLAVHVDPDRPPQGISPDVVIRPAAQASLPQRIANEEAGLVLLRDPAPESPPCSVQGRPTVHLPTNAEPREIVVACSLLAEIVRLRRSQRDKQDWEQQLTQLALTDSLTGVANRRGWEKRAVELLMAGNSASCVVLLDLDHFKEVNTQFGMAAGDACLREVAQRLSGAVRKDDLLARLGGDEFALWLPGVDAATAPGLVDRVRDSIGSQPLQSLPHVRVTASAGWVSIPATATAVESSETASRLLSNWVEQADRGLREAKKAGRDRTIAA
jgi:diguanylate cyclase (GGDEF)-like protein